MTNDTTTKNMFANMPSDIMYASAYGYLSGMLTAFEICVRHNGTENIGEDIAYLLMRFREVEKHKEARHDEITAECIKRNPPDFY
jgi:hypothetical protein